VKCWISQRLDPTYENDENAPQKRQGRKAMQPLRALLSFLALSLSATFAHAQTYPSKPVTIIVPAAPGGVTDALGRILAERFSKAWGQQVIVENKPGANNQIAAEYVAKAPGDGHTLLIGPEVTFVVNPSLYPKLGYDPVKDFVPITGLVTINHALILNPAVPVDNVQQLLALAKEKPGTLNYGTFGVGSSGHLNMELLQALSGVKLQAVHYKGATPALTDVMAGHIQLMFISVGSAVPQWKAGKVKLIAVGAGQRMALLPEAPTVAESGIPGYSAVSWFGLVAPAGTPRPIVDKVNAEVRRIFDDPEFRKSFLDRQYFESIAGTPEQLAAYLKSEEVKWSKVIRDANVKGE
jgi:tripartite-type tricarboxylate transporter receptor subunit TctC